MAGDDVRKDLEDQLRQLHEKKMSRWDEKRGREKRSNLLLGRKRSVEVDVFMVVVVQNDDFCFIYAIGYSYYRGNKLMDEFWVACYVKLGGKFCLYRLYLRCLPQEFPTEQDS